MLTAIVPWVPHLPPQAAGNTRPPQRLGGLTGPLHGRMAGTCRKPPSPTARSPAAGKTGGAGCLFSQLALIQPKSFRSY